MKIRRLPGLTIHFDENAPAAVLEAPVAPPDNQPTIHAPNLVERYAAVKKAGGKAREYLVLNGDIHGAEALLEPKSDVTSDSSPETPSETPPAEVETEAASEPAVEEQPPAGETPEQKSERKHRNDLRRLRDMGKMEARAAAAEAKANLLEKQLAESKGASAPPQREEKSSSDPNKPKRPRLDQFETVEKYESAMDAYEEARDQWNSLTLEQREKTQTQTQQFQQASEKWEGTKTSARTKYKDFDAVAFNPKTPASLPQIVEVQAHANAAEIMYYLGKHPEASAKIAELTEIPVRYGKFDTWAQLNAAMAKNPGLAYLVGEKRGLAKAEIARIGESLSKKPAPSAKDDLAQRPKPSGEVAVEHRGAPVGDDLGSIIKRAASGDRIAAREYKRRWRERELGELGHI